MAVTFNKHMYKISFDQNHNIKIIAVSWQDMHDAVQCTWKNQPNNEQSERKKEKDRNQDTKSKLYLIYLVESISFSCRFY